eukprot:jgi/Sobl393_1/16093/SZX60518.1
MSSHAAARAALVLYLCYLAAIAPRAAASDADDGVEAAAASIGVDAASLAAASLSTGFSVSKIADIVRSDPEAKVADGGVVYTCTMKGRKSSRRPHVVTQFSVASGDSPAQSTSTTDIVSIANWPANQNDSSVPLTEAAVFQLHSRAAATRKVYLAFKGCTTVGTWWNTAAQSKTGTAAIVTPRYVSNLNSPSSTSFSQSELQEIVAIWRNVASDYALWDIDITTEELTAAQMERSSLSDVAYGARVCIGGMPTWLKYDGPDPPLGMSAVAAFGEVTTAGVASKRDIFVFAEGVDAKAVMEAASHE